MHVIILLGVATIISISPKGFSMGCTSCIINRFNWKGLPIKTHCNFTNLHISNVDSHGGVSCPACHVTPLYSVSLWDIHVQSLSEQNKLSYLLLMSAPCSNRNKALALSPLLTALCSRVRPLVVWTSILAPASSSLLATDIWPVHRANSRGVWSSLSDKLKSGTMGRRPPLPKLPATREDE